MRPTYNLSDFLTACKDTPEKVFVPRGVIADAKRDFGLGSKTEIVEFISNGGLENLEFINSEEFELSKECPKPFTDGYSFKSGPEKVGYIAFYKGMVPIWNIKSFKFNLVGNEVELTHNPFFGLFKGMVPKIGDGKI